MRLRLWLLVLIICTVLPIAAQEDDLPRLVTYGEVATGQIDNLTPYEVYAFDGLRGDYLSIRARATEGNLDVVLTILDSSGRALANRDDSGGSLDAEIETLLIQSSERYSIVVARFGYGLGSTSGSYELLIERIGNSSASGSALRYGDSISNTITTIAPELYYSFRARQGDIINVTMQQLSGDLDPYVQIVQVEEGQTIVLFESDDSIPGSLDAQVENFIVPQDSTYYIVATRYGQVAGTSTGNFLLTLEESANSGQGNSPQAALPITMSAIVEGTLNEEVFQRYYRFEATQDDILTIKLSRIEGDLDSYLILADANLQELTFDDDSGEGTQNSQISDFVIPASGTYYLITTRYQQGTGNTSGRYRLELEGEGNAFVTVPENVARIRYGTAVTGSIDEITPEANYVFFATEEDVVTISMNRGDGDLDPFLSLLDAEGDLLINSENSTTSGQDARIERYTIPETGVYYIRAASQDAPGIATTGSYILVLAKIETAETAP